jgi:hypothetical protein
MDAMRDALARTGEVRRCTTCKLKFFLSAAERDGYVAKGLTPPKRCQGCISMLRAKREHPEDWR